MMMMGVNLIRICPLVSTLNPMYVYMYICIFVQATKYIMVFVSIRDPQVLNFNDMVDKVSEPSFLV